ncbi:MAG TPA: hypothetical protein VE135_07640 [Pyrinomonadaceae bacterium]|nr:hypothetical protein [Pyrinomonadaceae bacterium]
MTLRKLTYGLIVLALRVGLVAVIFAAGWLVYRELPPPTATGDAGTSQATRVQIVLRRDQKVSTSTVDVPVELYPVDIVAVRHEFFAERRAGERFDDFLKQRMKGRAPITAKFDAKGETTLTVPPGNWWIHATLPGDEDLEWRLPISVGGRTQIVELTPQNAYTRTKTF